MQWIWMLMKMIALVFLLNEGIYICTGTYLPKKQPPKGSIVVWEESSSGNNTRAWYRCYDPPPPTPWPTKPSGWGDDLDNI